MPGEKNVDVTIRAVQDKAELQEAVALCHRILRVAGDDELYGYAAWEARLNHRELMVAAWQNNHVVAAVLGRAENPDSVVMGMVACTEECRGQGITARLVAKLEQHARESLFRYITLGAAEEAHGFYERCGYRQIATIHDQRIYQKIL